VEEPTSPDDILGHAVIRAAIRPVPVATGEHGTAMHAEALARFSFPDGPAWCPGGPGAP
jgi:L-alanine-DL-glutamate epimerase-like enolase superfamily enzyme